MSKPTMCANHGCPRRGERRTVLGGCEECGQPLVQWEDPSKPTITSLAELVVSVALEPIEYLLRVNEDIRKAWERRLKESQSHMQKGAGRNATDAQWLKLIEHVGDDDQFAFPRRIGDPCAIVKADGRTRIIVAADGSITEEEIEPL